MTIISDLSLAQAAAQRAAFAIERVQANRDLDATDVYIKNDGTPVTTADRLASISIKEAIMGTDPDAFILDEETSESHAYSRPHSFWVVDPMDGTREFINRTGEYVVMVGKIDDSDPSVGVMIQPSTNAQLFAVRGHGAWATDGKKSVPIKCKHAYALDQLRGLVSRSRTIAPIAEAYKRLGAKTVQCGGAGYKAMLIATGNADLWLMDGNRVSLWDLCVSDLIIREAGGILTDENGNPIDYRIIGTKWPRGFIATSTPWLLPEIIRKTKDLLH